MYHQLIGISMHTELPYNVYYLFNFKLLFLYQYCNYYTRTANTTTTSQFISEISHMSTFQCPKGRATWETLPSWLFYFPPARPFLTRTFSLRHSLYPRFPIYMAVYIAETVLLVFVLDLFCSRTFVFLPRVSFFCAWILYSYIYTFHIRIYTSHIFANWLTLIHIKYNQFSPFSSTIA